MAINRQAELEETIGKLQGTLEDSKYQSEVEKTDGDDCF